MLSDESKNILKRKKYAELELLGIEPVLYFTSIKYINKLVNIKIKGDDISILSVALDKNNKHTFITTKTILSDLTKLFGIKQNMASLIINEWLRDTIINNKMKENITEYWDFITLSDEFEEIDEEYNF